MCSQGTECAASPLPLELVKKKFTPRRIPWIDCKNNHFINSQIRPLCAKGLEFTFTVPQSTIRFKSERTIGGSSTSEWQQLFFFYFKHPPTTSCLKKIGRTKSQSLPPGGSWYHCIDQTPPKINSLIYWINGRLNCQICQTGAMFGTPPPPGAPHP